MLITLVPNPNYMLSAQMMSNEALLQSYFSACVTLSGLYHGRVNTDCDKMWQGHINGLYSYLLTLDTEIQSRGIENVDRTYILFFEMRGITPKCDDTPAWVMDDRINKSHQEYAKNYDIQALVYPI